MAYKYDFEKIAQSVSVEDVADLNNLRLRNNRAKCPACNTDDDRALEIIPETQTFRCFAAAPTGKKALTGDSVALHMHLNSYAGMYRAAKELSEQFGGNPTVPPTPPKKEKGETNLPIKSSKESTFDAAAFSEKLEFTEEVKATGLSEEDAKALGVGVHRGKLYQALRYPSGTIAGFSYVEGGKLKPPKNLLPDTAPSKIVAFPKRA